MDGMATLLEYISPTSSSDQRIAKVLGVWRDPEHAGVPPSLRCFEQEHRDMKDTVEEFARRMRQEFFTKLHKRGFADCLTATLLMNLDETHALAADHMIHVQLAAVGQTMVARPIAMEELKGWVRLIRKQPTLDNLNSLPMGLIKANLTDRELAERHIGVQTFAESLERSVAGYRELVANVQDLTRLVQRLLHRQDEMFRLLQAPGPNHPTTEPTPELHDAVTRTAPPPPSRSIMALGRPWPQDFKTLRRVMLQDLIVRFVRDDLGTVAFDLGIRLHKEVHHAMQIVRHFADLGSIPSVPTSANDGDVVAFNNGLSQFGRYAQVRILAFVEEHRARNVSGKRTRSITGLVSGIVRASGELSDDVKSSVDRQARLQFHSVDRT